MNHNRKLITVAITVLVILTATLPFLSLGEEMDIYDKTLRLHILANSDDKKDQELKLKVRDAVIDELSEKLSQCSTKEEAEKLVINERENIIDAAKTVISENGVTCTVDMTVTEEYYPERKYEGISLPAGEYTSVRILLGEADGQNWWCVLFPQVCTDTARPVTETLAQVGFTPNQIRLLTEQEKPSYRIKFKLVELFSSLVK